MKVTNVRNIYSYISGTKIIGAGGTAFCYRLPDNRVLKLYIETYNKKVLFNNCNMLEHVENISRLGNDSYVVPDEVLVKDNRVVGYIYPFVEGSTLYSLRKHVRLNDLHSNFSKLIEDTVDLSNKGFKLFDVHNGNILFNDEKYHVIDLDKGRKMHDDESLRDITTSNVRDIIDTVINSYFGGDWKHIIEFKDKEIQDTYRKTYWTNKDDVDNFFKIIKSRCFSSNPTIGEVRKRIKHKIDLDDYKLNKMMR